MPEAASPSLTPSYMTFLTLWGRDIGTTSTYSSMKMAVYKFTEDSHFETDLGTVVALSDAHSLSTHADSARLLSGNDVQMDTTKQYRFLFVNDTTTMEPLIAPENATNLATYQAVAVSSRQTMIETSGLPGGDGMYKNSTANSWEGMFMPKLGITSYVLEPATATLSPLALAGLATRRRK